MNGSWWLAVCRWISWCVEGWGVSWGDGEVAIATAVAINKAVHGELLEELVRGCCRCYGDGRRDYVLVCTKRQVQRS